MWIHTVLLHLDESDRPPPQAAQSGVPTDDVPTEILARVVRVQQKTRRPRPWKRRYRGPDWSTKSFYERLQKFPGLRAGQTKLFTTAKTNPMQYPL